MIVIDKDGLFWGKERSIGGGGGCGFDDVDDREIRLVAFASSLDVIGCFCTTDADVGILLQAISGHDKHDATSRRRV
nr:glutamyl-tRNA(Gln) amidotransferase subunit A, chloroplastic/mitochondrial [Tanacetum cinerariifolium]